MTDSLNKPTADFPQRLLSKHQVAKLLGVRPETVARMARRRDLPALKVGGRYRFRPEALAAWIDAQTEAE